MAQAKYTSAAADALALLESMLLFNPDKRASLPDTLSSEYLKDSAQTCASPPPPGPGPLHRRLGSELGWFGRPLVPIDMEAAMKGHGVHMRFDWEYDPSFHTQDKLRTLLMEEQEKYARGTAHLCHARPAARVRVSILPVISSWLIGGVMQERKGPRAERPAVGLERAPR